MVDQIVGVDVIFEELYNANVNTQEGWDKFFTPKQIVRVAELLKKADDIEYFVEAALYDANVDERIARITLLQLVTENIEVDETRLKWTKIIQYT